MNTVGRILNLNQIGVYRDDGLIYIPTGNDCKTSRLQNKIIRAFRILGLRIEIFSNVKIVNFLDVTFDIDNFFKVFNKNNDIPTYIRGCPRGVMVAKSL